MNVRASRQDATAFTLIELVISSALMAMILVSAYLCLRSGIAGQKLVEPRVEILQSARVAMGLMSADLRCACVLSKEFEFLGMHRVLGNMQADNLDFATHHYSPRRPREGDWCEVSYFLDRSPASNTFSLWRRRDPTPDSEPLAGGSREEIARGVRGLRFEYFDGYDWYDEWGDPQGRRKGQNSVLDPGNLSGMPEAVRITLSFETAPQSAAVASPDNDASEPPLLFQTVVRLNLAASATRTASSGSSVGSGSGATAPIQQGPGNATRK